MRFVSIIDILKGLNRSTDVEYFRVVDTTPNADDDIKDSDLKVSKEKDSFAVVEERDNEGNLKKRCAYVPTSAGIEVINIFATIDAINKLDMIRNTRVLREYPVADYSIIKPLEVFIRPKKATVTGSTNGSILMKDLLEAYVPYLDDGMGTILSPDEFELAQLKFLRSINKRCVSLDDTVSVHRDAVVLTEADYQVYPVRVDGELFAVSKSDSIKLYPIMLRVYDDDEYMMEYTRKYVIDKISCVGVQLLKLASARGNGTTN